MSSGSYGVFSVRIFSLSAGDVRKGSMFARCNFDNFKVWSSSFFTLFLSLLDETSASPRSL
eukprot:523793-Amorphochlora_amoeboformis.AAC.1